MFIYVIDHLQLLTRSQQLLLSLSLPIEFPFEKNFDGLPLIYK